MHMALIFEKFSKVSSLSNMSTLVLTFFMELRKARPCDLGGALALFGTYYSKVTLDLLKIKGGFSKVFGHSLGLRIS